jgi:hypothetical protein
MSSQKATVIPVPNNLKAKMGGMAALDAAAIAKAEAAMQALSANFGQWLNDEVAKLEGARANIKANGVSKETVEGLYFRAHDLKGLGTTYEFPLVTKLAASLCRLIDDPAHREKAPMLLIDAHIDGIKAMVRDGIRDPAHPVGRVLAAELATPRRRGLSRGAASGGAGLGFRTGGRRGGLVQPLQQVFQLVARGAVVLRQEALDDVLAEPVPIVFAARGLHGLVAVHPGPERREQARRQPCALIDRAQPQRTGVVDHHPGAVVRHPRELGDAVLEEVHVALRERAEQQ